MRIRYNVNFEEIQPVSVLNKPVCNKKSYNDLLTLMKRQIILKMLLPDLYSISPSRQIPYKIAKLSDTSYRYENKISRRYNSLLTDYITPVPIVLRISPNNSFTQSRLIPVKKFSLFIPERSFKKLEYNYKSTMTRLKRLKEDISRFQKNRSEGEKKIRTIIKNQLLKEIIPALEELERAKNINYDKIKSKKIKRFINSFRKNLQMVYNSFIRDTGLIVITPSIGDLYNEQLHTILDIIYIKSNKSNNSIIEVVKSGYIFNGEILKPSQVIISTNNPNHPNLSSKQDISMKNRLVTLRKKIEKYSKN